VANYDYYVDYYKKRDIEIKDILGMNPTTPTQPAQGQPTTTQPQKPLNEGQEILKEVFKTLIK
jgi:hypothetical protein